MKSPILTLLFLSLILGANAQKSNDQKSAPQATGANAQSDMSAQQQAAMKAWIDYMTPGTQQQMLAKGAGDWNAEVTQWMDPSQPPVKTQGKVHNEMILGGRYLSTHYTGNMMGQPFEGIGTLAYDNGMKMYYSTWVDNMGTGISYMQGTPGTDGKSIEFKGSEYDPALGKPSLMREVQTFVDDNHQKMEFYQVMNGKEVKMMEMNLSR